MISVSCVFDAPLGRFDVEDYLRSLALTVWSYDEDGSRVVLGELSADRLLLVDAQMDGEDIFQICDADSQGLYEVYEALFEKSGKLQEELAIDEVTTHIVFLWESVLHPKVRPYEAAILEVIATLFGHDCVLAMWRLCSNLSDKELADCGFKKIAGAELLFRHVSLQTRFSEEHPQGVDVPSDFQASKEDEEWVKNEVQRRTP